MISETDAIEKIRKFIIKKTGLYFKQYDVGPLKENIDERISAEKCSSYLEYHNLLTNSAQSSGVFAELLNRITIKHTHFFRNPDQFIALRDKILPEIMERKIKTRDLKINILSAGCATGEEPYSIAMVLSDTLDRSYPWTVSILATDISTEALITAKRGIYPIRALQFIDKGFIQQHIEKYCLIHKDEIFVSPAIKTMVEFQYMNLIDEFYPQGFDIIFCRNVTIYFETETVKNVIEKFYQSLNEEGCFFTGGTETLYGIFDKFELAELEHALVYKKIPAKELKPAEATFSPWRAEPQITPASPAVVAPKRCYAEPRRRKAPPTRRREALWRSAGRAQIKEQITQISAKTADVSAISLHGRPAGAVREPAKSLKEAHALYEKAKIAFLKKDYAQAENLAKSALEIEPSLEQAHILLANIFVNQDRFKEAKKECQKAIDINFLSSQPRYLLGLIHKKQKEFKEALNNLRKAIYLNANFSLAHFTLAELYREKAQAQEAQKAYKNTLKSL